MSNITSPIYTGVLQGKPLRFFKAPLPGPHLPWHSVDDLHACLKLPRDLRREFLRRLKVDWKGKARTVATESGITTIGPHWMAQGFIGSMIENRLASAATEWAYAEQSVAAWNALAGDLPQRANAELMLAAFCNTNGIGRQP